MLTELRPYELVERNLRRSLAFYAGAHPSGEVRSIPGLDLIHCGWNYPVFNSALLTTPIPGPEGELSTRLSMATMYFRALGVGWSHWACHDALDEHTRKDLRRLCSSYGLEQVVSAPGMYAERLLEPVRKESPLTVVEVDDAPARMSFAHLVSLIFDLPFQTTMHMYGGASSWTPEYSAFIGYLDDQPVSIAMANITDECCGFYSVGTLPGYRRRGYAETVMREAHRRMQLRGASGGCVLQSSTVGRRLYEQMGFREVTRFSVFRSVPN